MSAREKRAVRSKRNPLCSGHCNGDGDGIDDGGGGGGGDGGGFGGGKMGGTISNVFLCCFVNIPGTLAAFRGNHKTSACQFTLRERI